MTNLKKKLGNIPNRAGVYYHLDKRGRIIYVGKAANLRSRVRHYFQIGSIAQADPKTLKLRTQIADIQWTVTENALHALFLESEMIKRYQPKYNVLERNVLNDGWHYVSCNLKPPNPNLLLLRDLDIADNPVVLGPYLDGHALRKALKYLRRIFPFSTHKTLPKKACLDYYLDLCPGPETETFDLVAAQANLRRLLICLKGRQGNVIKKLKQAMTEYARQYRYEEAAGIRNQIIALNSFKQSIIFTDLERQSTLNQDQALLDLQKLFGIVDALERIEAYDISHISGQYTTASMIVAQAGVLRPALSRRFKSKTIGNDDFRQIREVLRRRFASRHLKNLRPGLILIDGGRGQVSSVLKVLDELALEIPIIGLAKRKEQVVFKTGTLSLDSAQLRRLKGQADVGRNFTVLTLDLNTPMMKFLQRLRDASHRSALRYHNYLQTRAQTGSDLLGLPTIGEKTYKKLIRRFGSLDGLKRASRADLAEILTRRQLQILTDYLKIKS